ncbi:hypothetical protein ABWU59_27945 [Priestia megaterium]
MAIEKKECNHRKVYANQILMSNPPKIRWFCQECRMRGYKTYENVKWS